MGGGGGDEPEESFKDTQNFSPKMHHLFIDLKHFYPIIPPSEGPQAAKVKH